MDLIEEIRTGVNPPIEVADQRIIEIDAVEGNLPANDFYQNYVKPCKPVLLKGAIKNWDACKNWSLDYFKGLSSDLELTVKKATIEDGATQKMTLSQYVELLEQFEKGNSVLKKPPYLHDVGLFNLMPELTDSIDFDTAAPYFPSYYHKNWWRYVQFFVSVKGHITPLHFDTLLTHNLFFQVKGKKRFTLIPWEQRGGCYMHKWRWAMVNPKNPDLSKYPDYAQVKPLTVDVEGGDLLLMPSGMLHHVESQSFSISFNIDWHSKQSVIKGLKGAFDGAPGQNNFYNFLMFLALWCKVPEKQIWPKYRSYLSYIS